MLAPALRSLLISTLVGATATGMADAEFQPYLGPKPVLVWIQSNPWLMVLGSDTPRVVLYEDGDLVFFKGSGPTGTYRHRRLLPGELGQLRHRLGPVMALGDARPRFFNLAGSVTDLPEALLYARSGQQEVVTRIYGLDDDGTPTRKRIDGANEPVPKGPLGDLLELHQFLAALTDSECSAWKPRYLEVMIWPYEYAPDKSLLWPASWPGLTSSRTVQRNKGAYSIYVDGSLEDEIVGLLSKRPETGAIEIGGRKWAVSVRPVFPSEPVWQEAFGRGAAR
jgi:hypothetical protein